MTSLIELLAWAFATWLAGAATVRDPGPLGLSARLWTLWPADNPNGEWVLLAITAVAGLLTLTYAVIVWNNVVHGHHIGPDGVKRDRSGRPIWIVGPWWGHQ